MCSEASVLGLCGESRSLGRYGAQRREGICREDGHSHAHSGFLRHRPNPREKHVRPKRFASSSMFESCRRESRGLHSDCLSIAVSAHNCAKMFFCGCTAFVGVLAGTDAITGKASKPCNSCERCKSFIFLGHPLSRSF